MKLRILASIILLFSVLFMPFWVSAGLACIGIFLFHYFVEASIFLLIADGLFGTHDKYLFVGFLAAIVVMCIVELIKRKIKFYDK